MYEHHRARPLSPRKFALRLLRHMALAGVIVSISLLIGMSGYHGIEHLNWLDAFLNASMLLSGMGPVTIPASAAGKLFAGLYALYSGVVLLGVTALMLAPVIHRLLHLLHCETDETGGA
jgi:hypothetical protein